MKPTITNAFTVGSTFGGAVPAQRKARRIGQSSGSHGRRRRTRRTRRDACADAG